MTPTIGKDSAMTTSDISDERLLAMWDSADQTEPEGGSAIFAAMRAAYAAGWAAHAAQKDREP